MIVAFCGSQTRAWLGSSTLTLKDLLEAVGWLSTLTIDLSYQEDSLQLEESILAAGSRPVEKLSIHVSLPLQSGRLAV